MIFLKKPSIQRRRRNACIHKGSPTYEGKFYLSDDQGISNIKQVDEHEMILNLLMKIGISSSILGLWIQIIIGSG